MWSKAVFVAVVARPRRQMGKSGASVRSKPEVAAGGEEDQRAGKPRKPIRRCQKREPEADRVGVVVSGVVGERQKANRPNPRAMEREKPPLFVSLALRSGEPDSIAAGGRGCNHNA